MFTDFSLISSFAGRQDEIAETPAIETKDFSMNFLLLVFLVIKFSSYNLR